jgi:lactoylglutathione lyase
MKGGVKMNIEHVALWTTKLEEMKDFYREFFNGHANEKYTNSLKQFESYFITFASGARLEIMRKQGIAEHKNDANRQYCGLVHLAFSVGSKGMVDELTAKLQTSGYQIVSFPRTTGDGCYESCILDPDGNMVEITV